MTEYISLFFSIGIPLLLLILGYFIGSYLEKSHFQSIVAREHDFSNLPCVTFDELDPDVAENTDRVSNAKLVSGSVVVSVDYFKRFIASLRNIFGGRVTSYETLLDRARREAILRMKGSAPDASSIANMRIEFSTLSSGRGLGAVEIHAYGTAVYLTPDLSS